MTKVTYLIGAGASCGQLPMITQMNKAINDVIELISRTDLLPSEDKEYVLNGKGPMKMIELLNDMKGDFEWAAENARKHASIDTFAKKLFIKKDIESLYRLKRILVILFNTLQKQRTVDNRYDTFFASIIKYQNVHKLPSTIKIVSWNYDYQLELAYSQFTGNGSLEDNREALNILGKLFGHRLLTSEAFAVFKLNGSASVSNSVGQELNVLNLSAEPQTPTKDLVVDLIKFYADMKYVRYTGRPLDILLSFAWEPEPAQHDTKFLANVAENTKDTEILVVIGYSFPFFNREIDQEIIRKMNGLKKVYIQDPQKARQVSERFQANLDENQQRLVNDKMISIIELTDADQFYLPSELTL